MSIQSHCHSVHYQAFFNATFALLASTYIRNCIIEPQYLISFARASSLTANTALGTEERMVTLTIPLRASECARSNSLALLSAWLDRLHRDPARLTCFLGRVSGQCLEYLTTHNYPASQDGEDKRGWDRAKS